MQKSFLKSILHHNPNELSHSHKSFLSLNQGFTTKKIKRLVSINSVFAIALTFFGAFPTLVESASLQVSPILIDIEADKSSASTVTLRNTGESALNAQVRVFRWSQANGEDQYDETDDVVASPPVAKLDAKGSYVIRVVRTKQSAPIGEESYRLVIDELPSAQQKSGTVAMLVRHAIPVFFSSTVAKPAIITWSLQRKDGKTALKAVNNGDKRLRVANLAATSGSAKADFGKGLSGYVLGKSTHTFIAKGQIGTLSGAVNIKADTQSDPVNVTIQSR
jgi:fimbrial chaperone protein